MFKLDASSACGVYELMLTDTESKSPGVPEPRCGWSRHRSWRDAFRGPYEATRPHTDFSFTVPVEDGALHDTHRDALAMAQKMGFGVTVHAQFRFRVRVYARPPPPHFLGTLWQNMPRISGARTLESPEVTVHAAEAGPGSIWQRTHKFKLCCRDLEPSISSHLQDWSHFFGESLMHRNEVLSRVFCAWHRPHFWRGDNVRFAMDAYGATRIGHGYRSVGSEAYDYARSKGVHFELCPTSSVSTQAIELEKANGSLQWEAHPISRFFQDGTSCSINSDDPAVFRSSLTDELSICVKQMGLSFKNIHWMTLQALEHAFHLDQSVKDTLSDRVNSFYESAN